MRTFPLTFSAEMVKAMLAGKKCMTRRLPTSPVFHAVTGDLIWVKEVWAAIWPGDNPVPLVNCDLEYRADTGAVFPGEWPEEERLHPDCPRWRSPRFMPKFASRLTLEVVEVEPQQLKQITDVEAIYEGIEYCNAAGGKYHIAGSDRYFDRPRDAFAYLWDSLHGKGAWDENPEVAAISFKTYKININKFMEAK